MQKTVTFRWFWPGFWFQGGPGEPGGEDEYVEGGASLGDVRGCEEVSLSLKGQCSHFKVMFCLTAQRRARLYHFNEYEVELTLYGRLRYHIIKSHQ